MRINNELIRRCSSKHLLPVQGHLHPMQEEDTLERITHLYLQEHHIKKIENLDFCRNLIALYLYDNNIEEIENLDHLIGLNCLYLHRNFIRRIENLNGLRQLTVLHLGHNSISKVEGMQSLSELRELYIEYQTMPEDQSLEFDPATMTSLGKKLLVLNVTGNKLQSFSMLKPLECLQSFTAEENNVEDLTELVRVVSKWKDIRTIKLTGNPVCDARKYKDNIVVVCMELVELDGKVIPAQFRNFLLNWKQCQRLQDRKKESYAVLKPFLETQRYVSEQVTNFPTTANKWVKDQLTSTWESVRSKTKRAFDNTATVIQSVPNNLNSPKRMCFAQCECCTSQYYICPPGVGNGPYGETSPLQSTAGYWLYVESPNDTLKNSMIQNASSRYSEDQASNSTDGRSGDLTAGSSGDSTAGRSGIVTRGRSGGLKAGKSGELSTGRSGILTRGRSGDLTARKSDNSTAGGSGVGKQQKKKSASGRSTSPYFLRSMANK